MWKINIRTQNLEDTWASIASQISSVLSKESPSLPEEEHPIPFDAASDKPMEEQKYAIQFSLFNIHISRYAITN